MSAGTTRTRALVVAQVALCTVLVVGAGLLARSLAALHATDAGVRPEHVLSVRLMPVPNGYRDFSAVAYYPELLARIDALPQVRHVGYARIFPNLVTASPVLAPVALADSLDREVGAQLDVASPEFFAAVGMRLVRGRTFLDSDRADSARVAIVIESLARQLAGGTEVLGRRVNFGTEARRQNLEIVGVVSNATLGNYRHNGMPLVYVSALQAGPLGYHPTLQIATVGDPTVIADDVRRIVRDMGREHVVTMLPLAEHLGHSTSTERLATLVATLAAALAIALAGAGLFALLACNVASRTREFGIRLALGARPWALVAQVMRDAVVLTSVGIVAGVPLALWSARAVESLLFGVSPADPWTLTVVAVCLVALGTAAGAVPAARAARVDPVVALRAL